MMPCGNQFCACIDPAQCARVRIPKLETLPALKHHFDPDYQDGVKSWFKEVQKLKAEKAQLQTHLNLATEALEYINHIERQTNSNMGMLVLIEKKAQQTLAEIKGDK